MIYIKEEQQYKNVTKMINDLRWKDLEERRQDICLILIYTIVNHQVNISSEGRTVLMNGEQEKVKYTIHSCIFIQA